MKKVLLGLMIVLISVSFIFTSSHAKPFKIAAIFQTAIEEPWDGVIHQACLKAQKDMGNIDYEFTEKIAAADFEKVLREYAERGFDLIVGDAFLAGEEPSRRVAKDYPEIAFAFGSEFSYIGGWFDPPKAKEAAIAQIEAGADLIFAERFGVFEACKEKGVLAFGNMSDQNALAPDVVITGPVWDMYPTIKFCIEMVKKDAWVAMDLGEWSMMAKGGARLAPFHGFEKKLPANVIQEVKELEQKILNGTFRVPVDEHPPVSD
jgi:basic membrane lipoprotein Med (substrate-binding protein (PBP1-ABC) superfamily)